MSVLDPVPDFASEDGFLHAFLGLLAARAEVFALLDTTTAAPPETPLDTGEDDAVLHALLGLARLSGLVSQVAASWATVDPEPGDPPREAHLDQVEEILR